MVLEYNPIILNVCGRSFYWKVHFDDGEIIAEYDDTGKEYLYKGVLDKMSEGGVVNAIEWYPTYEGLPVFTQKIEEWQRPILFRRNIIRPTGERIIIYSIGWQATIGGKNYKSITYIDLPNDTITIVSE